MNRRSFMVRAGTMLGTSVLADGMPFPLSAVDTSAARALSGLSDWDAVRAQQDQYVLLLAGFTPEGSTRRN
jgi:hypothetical protein